MRRFRSGRVCTSRKRWVCAETGQGHSLQVNNFDLFGTRYYLTMKFSSEHQDITCRDLLKMRLSVITFFKYIVGVMPSYIRYAYARRENVRLAHIWCENNDYLVLDASSKIV